MKQDEQNDDRMPTRAHSAGKVQAGSTILRSYLSSHCLWASTHCARQAQGIETGDGPVPRFDIAHRSYCVSTVLCAVAFLEAAINEVFQDAADAQPAHAGNMEADARRALAQFWTESGDRAAVLSKYQHALILSRREPLGRERSPMQDANLLVKLRNALTHFVPESAVSGITQKMERQLKGRFESNRLAKGTANPFFPDHCLGAGCAAWAVRTAHEFADEVFRRLDVRPNYLSVGWDDSGQPITPSIR